MGARRPKSTAAELEILRVLWRRGPSADRKDQGDSCPIPASNPMM
jgi:hypothetical protein